MKKTASPQTLQRLNPRLAKSLQKIHAPVVLGGRKSILPYAHGGRMLTCVHQLGSGAEVNCQYCRSSLCLLCRRLVAVEQRRILTRQLEIAREIKNGAVELFLTFTLKDVAPAGVHESAEILVKGFEKIRRPLQSKGLLGWARVVEVKTALNEALECVHMHAILLFPAAAEDEIRDLDWYRMWQRQAGARARDINPEVAIEPGAVARYLTKTAEKPFIEDGKIGVADPLRYIKRVLHGHNKFSSGGMLKYFAQPKPDPPDATGLSEVLSAIPPSTWRRMNTQPDYKTERIGIEGEDVE